MLQAAIAAAPDYAEAYNNLGVLQREVGAIKVCTCCLKFVINPSGPALRLQMSHAQLHIYFLGSSKWEPVF